MLRIHPDRLDLMLAFKASPLAPRSGELAALWNALSIGPIEGKYVLLEAADGASWELGQLRGGRESAIDRSGLCFDDRALAEWEVFRRRWEAATGRTLPP